MGSAKGVDRRAIAVRLALGVLVVLCFSACGEEGGLSVDAPLPIQWVEFSSSPTAPFIDYPGKIAQPEPQDLAFGFPGQLLEVLVQEGEEVQRGTLLARLDAEGFRARLRTENESAEAGRLELARQEAAFEAGDASQEEVDRVRRSVETFDARASAIEKTIEESELRAPFRGTIVSVHVAAPSAIAAKQPVVTHFAEGSLRVAVKVPIQSLSLREVSRSLEDLGENLHPVVIANSARHTPIAAVLTDFEATADERTRHSLATFNFEVPKGMSLATGGNARVRVRAVPSEEGRGGLVATAFLQEGESEFFVWVVDPERQVVSRRAVEIDRSPGLGVTVASGLEDGEWIAASQVHELSEGRRVIAIGD